MPTHGSISKSGRTRYSTPKEEKTSRQKKKGPRITNRRLFKARYVLKRKIGNKQRQFDYNVY